MFKNQLGKNMEVYAIDMITKSRKQEEHVSDLEETFGGIKAI